MWFFHGPFFHRFAAVLIFPDIDDTSAKILYYDLWHPLSSFKKKIHAKPQ
jgi:hypothetical protein